MDIFIFNTSWMFFNIFLSLLPVGFIWLFLHLKQTMLRAIAAFLWLLYLPNTIYVITDLHHLIEQWSALTLLWKILIFFQYAIFETLGLTCFILALYPLEKIINSLIRSKMNRLALLIAVNFLMGFAMVIGKVDRINSWDVFFALPKVVAAGVNLLTSYESFFLGILFGLFANCFYFLFRDPVMKMVITVTNDLRRSHKKA